MTYDDANHLSAKIKPKQQRVKLFSSSASQPLAWKVVLERLLSSEIGGVGNGDQLDESQLLPQQRRTDRIKRGRNGVR